MLVKGTLTITGAEAAARGTDEREKEVIFKYCAPLYK